MLIKKTKIVNLIICLIVGLWLSKSTAVFAQSQFEDDSSFDETDQLDDEETDFGDDFENSDGFDSLDEGDSDADGEGSFLNEEQDTQEQYIDDSLIPEGAEKSLESIFLKQRQLLLEEKINAPLNVAYGAGTGLMIGGWIALLASRTARDTLRSIGLGIVTGSMVGVSIGTRSVWDPNAKRPGGFPPDPGAGQGSFFITPNAIGFNWKF
ncbi:hypothetical protein WDW89_11870 [Deltaproteobacteria bacterium TL4]